MYARLAQLVERKALNLVVVGSSPTVGICYLYLFLAAQESKTPEVRAQDIRSSAAAWPNG